MWTTQQVRLAVLLAVLGGAAWWLLRGLIEEPVKPPRERVPTHVVTGLRAIETDTEGRPKQRLVADQLRQFVDEDLSELDAPQLTLFEPDGAPPWEVSSRHGLLLSGGDEVRLLDQVEIDRTGTAAARSVQLTTSALTLWPKREYAQGDQPVRIESDQDWLTASGVRLWYAKPARAEFPGRVHIFVTPTQTESGREAVP